MLSEKDGFLGSGARPNATRRPSLEHRLREEVRAVVKRRSLRAVAREIGMSAPGLQHFLDGGSPMTSTMRKIRLWWERRDNDGPSVETAVDSLDLLFHTIPAHERPAVLPGAALALSAVFDECGAPWPSWMLVLLERT